MISISYPLQIKSALALFTNQKGLEGNNNKQDAEKPPEKSQPQNMRTLSVALEHLRNYNKTTFNKTEHCKQENKCLVQDVSYETDSSSTSHIFLSFMNIL